MVTILIWVIVILSAAAAVLGAMMFAARRLDGIDEPSDSADIGQDAAPITAPRLKSSVPLKLSLRDFRGLRPADFRNDARAMRDFGELVDVVRLEQVSSQPQIVEAHFARGCELGE